jgi:hypothetical protein
LRRAIDANGALRVFNRACGEGCVERVPRPCLSNKMCDGDNLAVETKCKRLINTQCGPVGVGAGHSQPMGWIVGARGRGRGWVGWWWGGGAGLTWLAERTFVRL